MRKLFLASLIGATVAIGTGCDALNKILTPVTPTKTGTTPTNDASQDAQKAQELLQGQLQQAAGFSANLQQAAGFGVVLNGPTSQLQQAAGLTAPGGAAFRTQSDLSFNEDSPTITGEFGDADLVASGSITADDWQNVESQRLPRAFVFDLDVATASKVPALQGAHLSGTLNFTLNSAVQGLQGTMTFVKGGASNDVNFTYTVTGAHATKWIITGPVMINGVQHWSHLEVNSDHTGNGWVAKDQAGSTDKRVAYCESKNGQWSVSLIENSAATSSVSMPWSN